MGRPPIGDVAMTDAERQSRHRLQAIKVRIAAMKEQRRARRTAQAINAQELYEKLTPILEGIEAEGRKTKWTISAKTVAALGVKLRRLRNEFTA